MTEIEFGKQLLDLQPGLLRYALGLKLSRDDANDLVQDTFLKAILSKNIYSDKGFLKAWTFTIMRNTFINNYRRNTLQNTMIDHTEGSYYLNQTQCGSSENPDSVYSYNEMSSNIDLLDNKFRKPFRMYLEGYKYKEISVTIKLKLGTVKSRIFIARKMMKDMLLK
jgi:RNA polymerase sigma-70 factor (ECF subfamily)